MSGGAKTQVDSVNESHSNKLWRKAKEAPFVPAGKFRTFLQPKPYLRCLLREIQQTEIDSGIQVPVEKQTCQPCKMSSHSKHQNLNFVM